MNIDSISLASLDKALPQPEISAATGTSFTSWLESEISALNNQIQVAEQQVQSLALGEHDNLHQVMISLEKAKLSFELGMQVRNKLLEGFQEIMRMQV